jgi:hypothetical protein
MPLPVFLHPSSSELKIQSFPLLQNGIILSRINGMRINPIPVSINSEKLLTKYGNINKNRPNIRK